MSKKQTRNEARTEAQRQYDRRPEVIARKEAYKKEVGAVAVSFHTYKPHLEKLKQFAFDRSITVSTLIRLALEEYCDIDLSKSAADELKTEIDTRSE